MHICTNVHISSLQEGKSHFRELTYSLKQTKDCILKMRTGGGVALRDLGQAVSDRWCNSIQELHRNLELRAR